jgi:DNA-binding HxlR family transcriptional regulator
VAAWTDALALLPRGARQHAAIAARLAELADAGVFERVVVDARPPQVEYRVTRRGGELQRVVELLVRASGD